MNIWKPTSSECTLIHLVARGAANKQLVTLEPGIRYNLNDNSRPKDMNIRLVSDDPDWNDTDLWDMSNWSEFRKGVTLSHKGEAEVDFYVYSRGIDGELETNIQVIYENDAIVRIEEQNTILWQRGC